MQIYLPKLISLLKDPHSNLDFTKCELSDVIIYYQHIQVAHLAY